MLSTATQLSEDFNQEFDTDIDLRSSVAEEVDREFLPFVEKINVPKEVLEKTILSSGDNCWDLSMHHRLSLSFIKFFGCPFCQQVIEDLQKHFTSFLKCNTIPIVCHQEEFTKASYLLKNTNLLHCSVNNEILKGFKVGAKSIMSHLKMIPKICKCVMEDKSKKVFLPSFKEMKKMKMLTMFEFYQVYKGEVWAFRLQEMGQRPNYGKLLMELGGVNNNNGDNQKDFIKENSNGNFNFDYLNNPERFLLKLIKIFPQFKDKIREERLQRNEALLRKVELTKINSEKIMSISQQQVQQQLTMTLDEVLEHNLSKRMFRAFLVNVRQGIEELMFLEEVDTLKTLLLSKQMENNNNNNTIKENGGIGDSTSEKKEVTEIIKKAKEIFETFFGENSLLSLTYNKEMSQVIEECRNNCCKDNSTNRNLNCSNLDDCNNSLEALTKMIKQQVLTPLFEVFKKTKIYQDMLHEIKLLDLSNFL